MVPNALQRGRLSSGLRRTDQQVAAELEVQRHQLGIEMRGKLANPRVGRLGGLGIGAQIERNPFDPRTVSGDVIRPQPLVRLLFGLSQISLGPGDR